MKKYIPAISIVIPMYNVEKYVGECLDSILVQTFDDYEVIVVDDCSTDKSCEIVESYIPKFDGKLQLIRSEKNSGGCPGVPRNTGIRFAIGEYILFVDSDDAITKTALEELWNMAEKFGADVVHFGKYYRAPNYPIVIDESLLTVDSLAIGTLSTEPVLLSDNLAERVKLFVERRISWLTVCNFVRREFIMKSNINFPNMNVAEDVPYTLKLICESKKFLCLPNIVYIYRMRENSQSHILLNFDKRIQHRVLSVFLGIEYLDEYMKGIEIFVKHSGLRYAVLNFFKELQSHDVIPLYAQVQAHLMDEFVRRELGRVENKTALTAFLFARMNVLNVQLIQAQNLLSQQPKEVQDFQRQQLALQQQQETIQQQAAQIQQLQQQLKKIHDVFR